MELGNRSDCRSSSLYADDIVIIISMEVIKSICTKLMKITEKAVLQIHENKTKYITLNRREVNYWQGEITIEENHSLKRVYTTLIT